MAKKKEDNVFKSGKGCRELAKEFKTENLKPVTF